MKKVSALVFLTLFSAYAFSSEPNNYGLRITNIRVDIDNEATQYQYKFDKRSEWYTANSEHINRILQIAYMTGVTVDAGLTDENKIITVVKTN